MSQHEIFGRIGFTGRQLTLAHSDLAPSRNLVILIHLPLSPYLEDCERAARSGQPQLPARMVATVPTADAWAHSAVTLSDVKYSYGDLEAEEATFGGKPLAQYVHGLCTQTFGAGGAATQLWAKGPMSIIVWKGPCHTSAREDVGVPIPSAKLTIAFTRNGEEWMALDSSNDSQRVGWWPVRLTRQSLPRS